MSVSNTYLLHFLHFHPYYSDFSSLLISMDEKFENAGNVSRTRRQIHSRGAATLEHHDIDLYLGTAQPEQD